MDLGLRTRTRGRAAKVAPSVLAHRELNPGELELGLADETGIKANHIKRLSHRHKEVAKALVSGLAPGQVAADLGLSPSRVSILQNDPTFKEYLAILGKERDETYEGLNHRLAGVAADAATILQDRLEDEPDQFDTDELVGLVKLGADRTGHGPKSTSDINVNVGLADKLKAARTRIKDAYNAPEILDITPNPTGDSDA